MPFSFYKQLLRPALFALDAETAHHFAISMLAKSGPMLAPLARKETRPRPHPHGLRSEVPESGRTRSRFRQKRGRVARMGRIRIRFRGGRDDHRPRTSGKPPAPHLSVPEAARSSTGSVLTMTARTRWRFVCESLKRRAVAAHPRSGSISANRLRHRSKKQRAITCSPLNDSISSAIILSSMSVRRTRPGLRSLQERSALDDLLTTIRTTQQLPETAPRENRAGSRLGVDRRNCGDRGTARSRGAGRDEHHGRSLHRADRIGGSKAA